MTSPLLALFSVAAHSPSRLESILWWLPAVSIAGLVAMVGLEIAQSLPEDRRLRQLAARVTGPLAIAAAVVVVLNVVRAADIVGFL